MVWSKIRLQFQRSKVET